MLHPPLPRSGGGGYDGAEGSRSKGSYKSLTSVRMDLSKNLAGVSHTERLRGLESVDHPPGHTPLDKHLAPLVTLTPGGLHAGTGYGRGQS